MVRASKVKRTELYKDHLVQVFVSKFLSGEIEELIPEFDPNYGYRFPLVEKLLGSSEEAESFLKRLSEAAILKKKLHDKTLFCPQCRSPKVSMRYNCPHCKSFNIRKSSLIEHLQCGYIDKEEAFAEQDKLVCPRCKKGLLKRDGDYRKAGIWCTCNDCEKSFDIPIPSHFCRACTETFTFEDAIYRDVFSYSLSDEAKQEASLGWILVAPIREFLESKGFKVETPGFLKGKSGASHMFDITAYKPEAVNDVTVIDVATSPLGDVSEQPVIAMFAKIYDVAPDRACLIAIPKVSANGKKMAKLYSILVIEAKNPKEAVTSLEESIMLEKKKLI